ncbi:MAG: hypothetical protein MSC31_11375 [Solirubrobacteraceae bacterium MAG38_C4-C5]|nr:hypothetical protein [Candidatus Siliceabacter maunaloa]
MVVGRPALVVPDDLAWTLWGVDPYADGLRPVSDAGSARRVLLPDRLPGPLGDALRRLVEDLPADRRVEVRAAPALGGRRLERVLAARTVDEDDDEEEGGGHDGDHHGDMMAITGSPGSDGLVMEPIDTVLGPLAGPLPGGLAISVRLAGDVVEDCRVDALLEAEEIALDRPPDALAPSAWGAVLSAASDERPERPWAAVAAVELERAVSHVAWLRTLARLLGWAMLVDGCTAALAALAAARREPDADDLNRSLDALASLRGVVRGRRMGARTRGRAVVDVATVAAHGLTGPVARAAGHAEDARSNDAAYAALGFTPVVEGDGDARARTVLRHAEAIAAVELAAAALVRREAGAHPLPAPFADAGGWVVEGPRGPLRAWHENGAVLCSAAGADAARTVAARSAIGQEWGGALVCLASFDLSPWRVGA